jgi:hypothetical protein
MHKPFWVDVCGPVKFVALIFPVCFTVVAGHVRRERTVVPFAFENVMVHGAERVIAQLDDSFTERVENCLSDIIHCWQYSPSK